jgi:hypothetical protein
MHGDEPDGVVESLDCGVRSNGLKSGVESADAHTRYVQL